MGLHQTKQLLLNNGHNIQSEETAYRIGDNTWQLFNLIEDYYPEYINSDTIKNPVKIPDSQYWEPGLESQCGISRMP